jgi:hypothetical protein
MRQQAAALHIKKAGVNLECISLFVRRLLFAGQQVLQCPNPRQQAAALHIKKQGLIWSALACLRAGCFSPDTTFYNAQTRGSKLPHST